MGTPSPLLRVVYDEAKSGGLTPDQASRRVAASDTITLLSHPTNPLCKTWRADGTIDPYANGKYFTHREEAVDGIASLSALLSSLEGDHNTCVIRGRYVGDETAAMRDPEHKAGLVRRIRDIYEDIPHQWMLTEVDDFEPLAADPAADPLAAIEEFIATRLPDPFRGASYHWQLSNSAGAAKNVGKLKVHIWFWLSRPYTSEQLKAWATVLGLELDKAVFQPVQIHYTAAPVFEADVADPVTVRSGFVSGLRDEVDLVIDEAVLSGAKAGDKSSRHQRVQEAAQDDPVANRLDELGMVKRAGRNGELFIVCPLAENHTSESGETSTAYFPAHTGGYVRGSFVCQHEHCRGVPQSAFLEKIGMPEISEGDFRPIAQEAGTSLSFIDLAALKGHTPPAREWVVDQWIPLNALTVLSGRGGQGKTLLAQQLATAVANGQPCFGFDTICRPVVGLFCEDDAEELMRRQFDIFGAGFTDPVAGSRNLHLDARPGKFNILATYGTDRILRPTSLLSEIETACEELGPVLVILDNIAQMYSGGENDRNEVTQFCNRLTALARKFNCAVLLLGHTAKAEGSEFSGSTAWEAAVRSRLFLARQDDGATILRRSKANYSSLDELRLEYRAGVFVLLEGDAETQQESLAAIKPILRKAVETFIGRKLSVSHESTARNYLLRRMEDEGMLEGIPERTARRALGEMIDAGELIPKTTMPWFNSSRHRVQGLGVAE